MAAKKQATTKKAGAIAVPIYPKTGKDKVKRILDELEIDYLIADWEFKDILCERLQHGNELKFFDKTLFIKLQMKDENLDNDVAMILLSSGTTGEPKGIMLTNANITSNIRAISTYLNVDETDVVLHMKNMYHSSSIIAEALLAVLNGCTLVLMDNVVTPRNIVELIKKYSITIVFTVPTLLTELLSYAKRHNEYLNSVCVINFYGAPINSSTLNELLEYFKDINFIYSYGLTEASPRVSYADRSILERKGTSVGKAIDGVGIKIVDGGNVCSVREIGEVVVHGSGVMKGYYSDELKTKHANDIDIDTALFMENQSLLSSKLTECRSRKLWLLAKQRHRKEILKTKQLIELIDSRDELTRKFDEELFDMAVKEIKVSKAHDITFQLHNGLNLTEENDVEAWDEQGRERKFQRDVNIAGCDSEKCKLVTPILTYADIEILQELIRQLRHA